MTYGTLIQIQCIYDWEKSKKNGWELFSHWVNQLNGAWMCIIWWISYAISCAYMANKFYHRHAIPSWYVFFSSAFEFTAIRIVSGWWNVCVENSGLAFANRLWEWEWEWDGEYIVISLNSISRIWILMIYAVQCIRSSSEKSTVLNINSVITVWISVLPASCHFCSMKRYSE